MRTIKFNFMDPLEELNREFSATLEELNLIRELKHST